MTQLQAQRPIVYQINTRVWLNTLSAQYGRPIHLGNIPQQVIDELASYHVNFVWLMGIWHRGEKCRQSALNYIHEYRVPLPDVTPDDVIGSAYAIGGYRIDKDLGGKRGLETFRRQILAHGIRLMLDFVPNHVGLDHPWLTEHPEYFVQGTPELLQKDPGNFFPVKAANGATVAIAHGRDPNFPGWIDTAQLNIFNPELRAAVIDTLTEIATMCDAVRCDMAMLMVDEVFLRTWGWRGLKPLPQQYWREVIPAIKSQYPNFLFIAEVYWHMEYEMLQQGFDYTYDKTLYDHALKHDYDGIFYHFKAELAFLERNIRFIENHDEPRAAASFGVERSKVFATLILTVPGAVLLHDGQFVGRRVKLPVQITRQPKEPLDMALASFYRGLLAEATDPIYRHGRWQLFERSNVAGSTTYRQVLAYGWQHQNELRLIVLNMGEAPAAATINLGTLIDAHTGRTLILRDALSGQLIEAAADDLLNGWVVQLAGNQASIYHVTLVTADQAATLAAG